VTVRGRVFSLLPKNEQVVFRGKVVSLPAKIMSMFSEERFFPSCQKIIKMWLSKESFFFFHLANFNELDVISRTIFFLPFKKSNFGWSDPLNVSKSALKVICLWPS
jgi:hypothetical protein